MYEEGAKKQFSAKKIILFMNVERLFTRKIIVILL